MKQAALVDCSRRELAMTPKSRRGAIVALLAGAAFFGYHGVKGLLRGVEAERQFPTGYESWDPWLGALLLAGALVAATGALVLIRSARRERLEPTPTIRARALENAQSGGSSQS